MLIFVFTESAKKTHTILKQWGNIPIEIRVWSYAKFFREERLPRATYILGDFDRLNFWDLELAGRICRFLKANELKVLNDPARALERYPLLRKLHAEGLNSFRPWLLQVDGMPKQFPVFLRTASSHRGALSELLFSEEEVRIAAEKLIGDGIPGRELLAVEYAAEPIGIVFRKYAAHRVGGAVITSVSVHQSHWEAKHGTTGIASSEMYAEEKEMILQNRYADEIRAAFDLAEIEYGRADFGIVGGRIQVYEINTNPTMGLVVEHPNADRIESDAIWRKRYIEALAAIDCHAVGGRLINTDPVCVTQRRKDVAHTQDRFCM